MARRASGLTYLYGVLVGVSAFNAAHSFSDYTIKKEAVIQYELRGKDELSDRVFYEANAIGNQRAKGDLGYALFNACIAGFFLGATAYSSSSKE